jgi:two-component system sensor histidine kinase/response regulator
MEVHKIIVVEDDESIRSVLVEILTDEGYNVSSFKNGAEALESLLMRQQNDFALIVLDLNMPVMNGYEFTDKIRENQEFSLLPIIVISAEHDASAKLCFPKITRYLKKPLDISRFLELVEESIGI